jgi:hypothetical protein
MLGEKISEGTGKVTGQRVLPNPNGGPKMETSFQQSGRLYGVEFSDNGTYIAVLRTDGTLFGEGQGVTMGKDGELATWTGQGVGKIGKDGVISYRGAVYFHSATPKWSRLNSVAALFEYEIDAQGNTRSQTFEWK